MMNDEKLKSGGAPALATSCISIKPFKWPLIILMRLKESVAKTRDP